MTEKNIVTVEAPEKNWFIITQDGNYSCVHGRAFDTYDAAEKKARRMVGAEGFSGLTIYEAVALVENEHDPVVVVKL